jgi:lysophospholipase L1-like esterase
MKVSLQALCCLSVFLLWSFVPLAKKEIKIYLVGDSTMSQKEIKAYPETGWGMPFTYFFDSSVTVDNRAKNGRSTRTFIEEGLWNPILQNLKEGDYVFIQFGHNDEVSTKKSFTTEEEFKKNLSRYVAETRSRKAIPVLLTPAARRNFDSTGRFAGTHEVYSELVRNVAQKEKVDLIDLDQKSKALLQQMGPEPSKLLFNQLLPGEHPNYPKGVTDNTHFNELGARKMAQLVLAGIRELHLELAGRIRKPSAN